MVSVNRPLFAILGVFSLSAQTVSTGIADIDQMAREVYVSPTTAQNARQRLSMLSLWHRLLMHQGVDMSGMEPVLEKMGSFRNPAPLAIDEGYRLLAEIQANPRKHATRTAASDRESGPAPGTDWGLFHGGNNQAGYTDDPGPSQGKLAWRFPIGHAWYARPAVENGRVYVASPGIVTIAYCLDEATGRVIWKAKQFGVELYNTPRVTSGAVVLKDAVVVRESGSGGEGRNAVDLVYIDKQTGRILKEMRASHVDYRRGYAPVAGDERYLVHTRGYQSIQNRPPLVWMLNTVVLKDAVSGENLWEMRTGDIFGEPVLADGEVFVATAEGILYSLNVRGAERVRWTFDAGAFLSTPAVHIDSVISGANDGSVYAIDRATGKQRWVFRTGAAEDRAFQFYSTPRVAGGRVYIGGADRNLYCLDARSGKLLWKATVSDWVRSRPIVAGDAVIAASIDGRLHAFSTAGKKLWETAVTSHQILADLEASSTTVLVSSNDLYLTSIDPASGKTRWRHSLLESAFINDERVPADVISGGADYQSPPAAVNGFVYVGSPSRFVHAVRADTGKEIWRFEASGQVSGQPIVVAGRVYFGQQGGDKNFYCVDARTGKPIWKKPLGWAWVSAGYRDGTLYVGTVQGEVHAIRAQDGESLWTYATNGGVYPAPPADEESVYTGSWDGHYYAFDRRTGVPRWAYFLGGVPDSAAPILWKGKLVIQALGRYLDALDTRTGESVWRFDVPKGFNINATPAASGTQVFISIFRVVNHFPSGARLFALDDSTGKVNWEFRPGGGLTGASVARDRVYFASTADVFFTSVNAKSGELLWRYKMGGVVEESCPAIHGRRAFILCSDRYLYAFE
jgi:outer membrane protein assembly factor BamB